MIVLAIGIAGCDKSVSGSESDPRYSGVAGTGNAGRLIGTLVRGNQPVSGAGYSARLLRIGVGAERNLVKTTNVSDSGVFAFDSILTADYVVEVWKDGVLRGGSNPFHLVDSVESRIFVAVVEDLGRRQIDLSQLGGIDSVYVDYRENVGIRADKNWLVQTLRDTGFVVHTYLSAPRGRWEAWYYQVRDGQVVLVNVLDGLPVASTWRRDSSGYALGAKVVALWDFDSVEAGGVVRDRSLHGNDLYLQKDFRRIRGLKDGAIQLDGRNVGATTGEPRDNELRRGGDGERTYEIRFRLDSIPESGAMICVGEPSLVLVVAENRSLLIRGMTRNTAGEFDTYLLYTASEVRVGEWMDLVVSIDEPSSEIYAWINGLPQTLYAVNGWVGRTGIGTGFYDTLELGTSSYYVEEGWISIDEMRISDTLTRGKGAAVQIPRRLETEFATDGSTVLSLAFGDSGVTFPPKQDNVFIGKDPANGSVHRVAIRPILSDELNGKEIITAWLEGWDQADTTSGTLELKVCPLTEDWSDKGEPSDWNRKGSGDLDVDMTGCTTTPILDGSRGFFGLDITDLVRKWSSKSIPNRGMLVQAVDESRSNGKRIILSSKSPVYQLGLKVVYR